MKSIFKIILILVLISCKTDSNKEETTQNQETNTVVKKDYKVTMSLESMDIKDFPPEIDGCACYFSTTPTAFKNGKYVYATNYRDTAFLKLNGVITKFILKKAEGQDKTSFIWTNDNYILLVETIQQSQIDETWQQTGKMVLKSEDKILLERDYRRMWLLI
jgi:hypothetical protein